MEDVWADVDRPEALESMSAIIDRTMGRRSVADVLVELDSLDRRIVDHLWAYGRPHDG